jgi:hypothetical protein
LTGPELTAGALPTTVTMVKGSEVEWVCALGSEDDGELSGGGVVTYWSPEQLRQHGRATVNGGDRCDDDSGHKSKQ